MHKTNRDDHNNYKELKGKEGFKIMMLIKLQGCPI